MSSINAILGGRQQRQIQRQIRRPRPRPRPSSSFATPNAILGGSGVAAASRAASVSAPPPVASINAILNTGAALTSSTDPLTAAIRGGQQRPRRRLGERDSRRQLNRILAQAQETVEELGFPQADAEGLARAAVRTSRSTGVPASVLMGLVGQESAFGTNTGPSSAGARGVAQFLPGTRDTILQRFGVDAFKSPAEGVEAAGLFLKDQLDQFGDVRLALAAYNAGPGNVQRFGGIPPFEETQSFVPQILERAERFSFLDRVAGGNVKVPAGRTTGPEPPRPKAVRRFISNPGGDNFRGLDPGLQRRAVRLGRLSGDQVQLTSGLRTREEQAELFRNRSSNPFPVAQPGSSRHETGLAFDANLTPQQRQLLPRVGLGTPVLNDPVHVEIVNRAAAQRAASRAQTSVPSLGGGLPSISTGVGGGRETPSEPVSRRVPFFLGSLRRPDDPLGRLSRNRLGGGRAEDEDELPPPDQLTVDSLQAAFTPRRRLPLRR